MQDIRTHIDDWIAAALAGDLSPEEQTAFDRHLQESGESRALFEETTAMSKAIEETLQTNRPGPGFSLRNTQPKRYERYGFGSASKFSAT